MTTVMESVSLQRGVLAAVYTKTSRIAGTFVGREQRFSDAFNALDSEFVSLANGARRPLFGETQGTTSDEIMVRRSDILLTVPVGDEPTASRVGLKLPRNVVPAELSVHPFAVSGALHLAPGIGLQEHVHNYRSRFLAVTDATIICQGNPELNFTVPFLLVNREQVDVVSTLQTAVSGPEARVPMCVSVPARVTAPAAPPVSRSSDDSLDDDWVAREWAGSAMPLAAAAPPASRSSDDASDDGWVAREWMGRAAPLAAAKPQQVPFSFRSVREQGEPITGEQVAQVLSSSALFRGVDTRVLERMCRRWNDESTIRPGTLFSCRRIPAGNAVLKAGDEGGELYIVGQGMLRVQSGSGSVHATATLGYLGPGDVFGEMAAMGDGRHMADVVTTTDAEVLMVSKSALTMLMGKFPRITTAMLSLVHQRTMANAQRGI